MITLLHGLDILASRTKLDELKLKAADKEKIILEGDKLEKTDIIQALETQSLFSLDRLIIIENLLSLRPSKNKDELIRYIAAGKFDAEIILWENKEATPAVLKKFTSARIYNFKPSANIFRFVDNLRPKGGGGSLLLFHELIKNEAPEVIFVMIVRQIRSMLLAKDQKADYLSKFAPWQKTKIKVQAADFSLQDLLSAQRRLLDMDYKIKSGQTPFNLVKLLDIFLLNL